MKKRLLIMTLVLSSCCSTPIAPPVEYISPWPMELEDEDCGYVDGTEMTKIVISYSAQLKRKHHLELEDSRIYYDDKITKLRLDYYSQSIIELCEARQVVVDIMDGFLERINSNPVVGFQVDPKPLGYENIEVHITYGSYHVLYVDPMYIAHVIVEDGIAYYYNAELDDKQSDYWQKRIESYPKTREIALIDREVKRLEDEDRKRELEQRHIKNPFNERFLIN